MELQEMVESIISDLGGDVLSVALSVETIESKIKESLRKVGAYSPKVSTEAFTVTTEKVIMPLGTLAVLDVMSVNDILNTGRGREDNDDFLFSPSAQMMSNPSVDPTSFLMKKNEIDTIMNFVEVTDWYYVKGDSTLFLNYYNRPTATIKYLRKYRDVNEVEDDEIIDVVQSYALALCKIVEGTIRRKLSGAPGAIVMDGAELVQEGKEEKLALEEFMRKQLTNLVYGIRA
jgi:hypothetical protein